MTTDARDIRTVQTPRHALVTKSLTAGLSTSMVLAIVAVMADSAQANPPATTEPAQVADTQPAPSLQGLGARLGPGEIIHLDVPALPEVAQPAGQPAARPSASGSSTSTRKARSTTARKTAKRTTAPKKAPAPKPATSKQSG
ncbi:MAG: hypothetical protein V9E89_08670 [Ilumatobacteraceae bacterium]